MFCPKCGSLLVPKKDGKKTIFRCSCGYVQKEKPEEPISLKEELKTEEKKMAVVENEDENLPLADAECPKCGHKKAYYWMIQTRAGDEPETRFFKCEKCKNVWREY